MERANIKVQPCKVYWGKAIPQVEKLTIGADAAGSMNNKFFFVTLPSGAKMHVWFNINDAGVDPAPVGSTGIEVAGATGATGSALAGAAATALALVEDFADSEAAGAVLTVTRADPGLCIPISVGIGTGFTAITMVTLGDSEDEVGYTEGDLGVTPGIESEDITSHQTGKSKIGKIQTGVNPKLKITFKETSPAQLRKVFSMDGSVHVPAGAAATPLMGFGSGRMFQGNFSKQRPLRLHPMAVADADKTQDVNFWLVYPNLGELSFSAEKVLMLPLDFEVYQDPTKPAGIDYFAIGDATQLS